ncbi:hypothetical protein C1I91_12030 [Clostridium manihotivorum]|uniref:Uncharacterized protein n=1 Tax=Clostridium manihotivorum TaxID=2320868 RepID=A0A3R5QTM2_9CLOT|nr:hypothetical protein C1I91_12030 [Clostridium manihotivorum]
MLYNCSNKKQFLKLAIYIVIFKNLSLIEVISWLKLAFHGDNITLHYYICMYLINVGGFFLYNYSNKKQFLRLAIYIVLLKNLILYRNNFLAKTSFPW